MADTTSGKPYSTDPTGFYVNWKRFNSKGLGYNFAYGRYGRDFVPGTGFQMRNNYAYYNAVIKYGWIRGESSPIQQDNIEVNATEYQDNRTGSTQTLSMNAGYVAIGKTGWFSYLGLNHQYENVTDSFSFSDNACVIPGKYNFDLLEYHGQTPATKKFYVGADVFTGTFYDGNRFSIALHPGWNVSSSLQLSAEYSYDRVRFNERNQKFDGHILKFRTMLMFSTKLSLSAFVQYNSAEANLMANLRLRYNPREGNDFYVVFNEGRNTSIDNEVPRMPAVSNRAILIKYTYTFSVGGHKTARR